MPAAKQDQDNDEPRILVVDDSRVIRVTITRVLDTGYHVLQASDGQMGLERARKVTPDLVISDIMMPNLDGYGLICAIRGEESTALSDVPIIVITSAEDDDVRERAYACGASAFILKPFDATHLLNTIRKHLDNHHASAAELAAIYDERIESIVITDIEQPEDAD